MVHKRRDKRERDARTWNEAGIGTMGHVEASEADQEKCARFPILRAEIAEVDEGRGTYVDAASLKSFALKKKDNETEGEKSSYYSALCEKWKTPRTIVSVAKTALFSYSR